MMYSKNRESPKSEDSEPTSSPQLISLKPIMDFGDTLQKVQISNDSKSM